MQTILRLTLSCYIYTLNPTSLNYMNRFIENLPLFSMKKFIENNEVFIEIQ